MTGDNMATHGAVIKNIKICYIGNGVTDLGAPTCVIIHHEFMDFVSQRGSDIRLILGQSGFGVHFIKSVRVWGSSKKSFLGYFSDIL